jgi:hypothetical protein
MSCDNWTYSTAILDLVPCSSPTLEVGDYFTARETKVSPKQDRPGLSAEQFKSKRHRHEVQSHIPDSTQTNPEYVWGDEGPIND